MIRNGLLEERVHFLERFTKVRGKPIGSGPIAWVFQKRFDKDPVQAVFTNDFRNRPLELKCRFVTNPIPLVRIRK